MAKVRSSLGEIVDFDMMKIMSELNAPPVRVIAPKPVDTFVNEAPVVAEEPAAPLVVKQPETKAKR
jgi:hypothetical protein